jgi:putative sigma-54 modulation protein
MKIEYTGRSRPVPPRLRALVERKLAKLEKVLDPVTQVHVVLASEGRRHHAEVTVHSRQLTLVASEEDTSATNVLSQVIDKLTRQAQKHIGRRREGKRRTGARDAVLWSGVLTPAGPKDDGPRIIDTRRFVVRAMTVDEAAEEVGSSEHGFVVFRDARTHLVSVLYKRSDGNLGLLEPEL